MDTRIEQGSQAFCVRYEAFQRSREPAVVPEPPAKKKVLEQEKTLEKKQEQELKIKRDRGFGHSR